MSYIGKKQIELFTHLIKDVFANDVNIIYLKKHIGSIQILTFAINVKSYIKNPISFFRSEGGLK